MKMIIIGCGRMGAGLAQTLHQRSHNVTVVDKDPSAFERLGSAFKDKCVVGVGFDRDMLLKAGIERADGLAAVTASDEANVVTARLASIVFHVPRVVARVYDPRKAAIYQRLGLQTISTTTWGINRIAEMLCFSELDTILSLGNGEVEIAEAEIPPLLAGRTVSDFMILGEVHVVSITRDGKTFLPPPSTVLKIGDRAHLAVLTSSAGQLHKLLGLA
jgi:trk/ktr system potassium uptake protein